MSHPSSSVGANLGSEIDANAAAAAAAEQLLQQLGLGLNAFMLMQQLAAPSSQLGSAASSGSSSGIFPSPANEVAAVVPKAQQLQKPQEATAQDARIDEDRRRELNIIGKRWAYVATVQSFAEFEQLRCQHQVSRNRTFAHGIRYSCTQKTQLRSNCPYLLLCLFSDGATEHSAHGVGRISVYSRNEHTHKVKTIKARQPRSIVRMLKMRREEEKQAKEINETNGEMLELEEEKEEIEMEEKIEAKEVKRNEAEKAERGAKTMDHNALLEMLAELSKQLMTGGESASNSADQ